MTGKPRSHHEIAIASIHVFADDGRLVNIGYQSGSQATIDFMRVMLKRLTITGSTLRIRTDDYKGMLAKGVVENVWPMIKSGHFRPLVSGTFTMAEADAAHAKMDSSDHAGKIILQVGG